MSYPDITQFTLNETPFTEPIKMLKVLLNRGQIEVTWIDSRRKQGLSENHVSKVKFLEKRQQGDLFSGN